jgi:hypothetical protein
MIKSVQQSKRRVIESKERRRWVCDTEGRMRINEKKTEEKSKLKGKTRNYKVL